MDNSQLSLNMLSTRYKIKMKAEISENTKNRVSEIIDKPVERNFDKAVNLCLDKLENGNSVDVLVCDQTEKMAEDEE